MTFGDHIPFNSCNDNDFLKATIDSVLPVDSSDDNHVFLNHHIDDNDIIIDSCDCKYFSVSDFNDLKRKTSLNILHNNINGLERKFENFNNLICNTFPQFDIIAVSETTQRDKNEGFFCNVNIDGYKLFSIATKSSRGGAALYLKSSLNSIERTDLNQSSDQFECV